MLKIYVTDQTGHTRLFELENQTVSLGRSLGNDVQVKDKFISRKHLEISREENRFIIKDLKSFNGTFLKGSRISPGLEYEVNEGFPIQIGWAVISIGKPVSRHTRPIPDSIGRYEEALKERPGSGNNRAMTFEKNMALIHRVSGLLMQPLKMEDIFEKILDCILDLLKRIDRGAIVLIDRDTKAVSKAITRGINSSEYGGMCYWRAVIDRVIEEGKAVSILNTEVEDEESLSETLKLSKIKCVMCVPLGVGSELRGAFYVDSVRRPYGFRKEDHFLLVNLSSHVAMVLADTWDA